MYVKPEPAVSPYRAVFFFIGGSFDSGTSHRTQLSLPAPSNATCGVDWTRHAHRMMKDRDADAEPLVAAPNQDYVALLLSDLPITSCRKILLNVLAMSIKAEVPVR